ncbi:MAG: glycosyltransferase, partial [Planctomycetes bacterium]|nr:glycosyltransferase [Planctomycetota bacterium]
MKILHLNEHLGWRGGIETYLLTMFPHLEERGHPQVAVFAEGDSDLVGRSHRLPLLGNAGRSVRTEAREQMLRILDEEEPDVVHVHNIYNIGAIEACLATTPTIVTSHDYRYICPASTLYYRRTEEVCPR